MNEDYEKRVLGLMTRLKGMFPAFDYYDEIAYGHQRDAERSDESFNHMEANPRISAEGLQFLSGLMNASGMGDWGIEVDTADLDPNMLAVFIAVETYDRCYTLGQLAVDFAEGDEDLPIEETIAVARLHDAVWIQYATRAIGRLIKELEQRRAADPVGPKPGAPIA